MAVTAVRGANLPSKFRHLLPSPPKIASQIKPNPASPPPPIFISTNPSHVNLHHLRELYAVCNHSCHRFPNIDAAGRVEPIDAIKLRTALSHSSIVVSVFTKPQVVTAQSSPEVPSVAGIGGDWIRKVAPVTPENGRLVGFGRVVSDLGLTASIHDVMVSSPCFTREGIGRMIVRRIIRVLTNRDIYDISALCNDEESLRSPDRETVPLYDHLYKFHGFVTYFPHSLTPLFFRACGFGDDVLGSTTMMYMRSASKDEHVVSAAGRKLLLVPPRKELTT